MSTLHPWNTRPFGWYGNTGTSPLRQDALVPSPRNEAVTRSYAAAGSRRATALGTKASKSAFTWRRMAGVTGTCSSFVTTCTGVFEKWSGRLPVVFGISRTSATTPRQTTAATATHVSRRRCLGEASIDIHAMMPNGLPTLPSRGRLRGTR